MLLALPLFLLMSLNPTQLAADMAVMVSDLPTSVLWGSQTFNAVVGDIATGDDLAVEGYTATATLTVDYVLSAVTGAIAENDTVTIGGVVYRVSKPSILPDGVTGHFECTGGEE